MERILLIYNGKSMEDNEKISNYTHENKLTVFVITKTEKCTNIYNVPGLIGLEPINWIEIQKNMQKELNQNPEMLKQMLNNPLVNNLMANPNVMRQLITKNTHLKPLLQRNKEINRMLKHSNLLETTREVANSSQLREELINSRKDGNSDENWWGRVFPQQQPQDLMQKMIENTKTVRTMLLTPYINPMLEALAVDCKLACNLFSKSPIFQTDPVLKRRMVRFLPQFLQQLQHPDVKNLITTENALKAIDQIQQGVETLKQNVPECEMLFGRDEVNVNAPQEQCEEENEEVFAQFMTGMINYLSKYSEEEQYEPPEKRYKQQIDDLEAMGFSNKDEYLKTLIVSLGNMDETVLKCLNN